MHILINFSTLKTGGGQNVGLNFLHSVLKLKPSNVKLSYLIAKDSDIHKFAVDNDLEILAVLPRNPVLRILKEFFVVNRRLLKAHVDVIYSYFGVGFFTKKIPQVSGSADSNLYFPEVDFWKHYRGVKRISKWFIDKYRIWGIKHSSAVVFENQAMERNGRDLFGLTNTCLIKPSVNFQMQEQHYELPFKKSAGTSIGLFLCGWQLNKNIMLIPKLARVFKDKGVDFRFILTAPDNESSVCEEFKKRVEIEGVKDRIFIVGSVAKSKLSSLYSQVDFVFLLSLLESFSNNIIEAWYFGKPLVVADEEWSRSICSDGACYVNRDDPYQIASRIFSLLKETKTNALVEKGKRQLDAYPSIDERTMQELEYVKSIAQRS